MFLIIRIPPQLAIAFAVIGIIANIWHLIKALRFMNKNNVDTAECTITNCKSTRYSHIYYLNTFDYTYRVEGVDYEKEDSESIFFKKNRESYPTTDTVEYLKSNPGVSRLKLINYKWQVLKCFLTLLFIIAFIGFVFVFYM